MDWSYKSAQVNQSLMAIEFNCPYCTATIRVPDMYAGKQGKCPKCDTRLLVPNVPLPNQQGSANPALPTSQPAIPTGAQGQTPIGPEVPLTDTETGFVVRPVTTSVVKSRRRQARRRPSRALVIGLPVICFLILFAVIAITLTSNLPKLQGELSGRPLEGMMLPKSVIAWSDIGLTDDDRRSLQNALSTQPETLTSQIIVCRLSADDDGIVVTLSAQPESRWIAVDVSAEKPLAIWRRKEGVPLNRQRLDELSATAVSYAGDKLQKINGVQLAIDAVAIRDKLALNAAGGPLSYAVQAVAGSTIYPCAAEDPDGTLYFCLPTSIQSFVVKGRKLAGGEIGFTGEYTVTIANQSITTDTKADADGGMPKSESGDGESPMKDEMPESPETEMNDENSGSMNKMSKENQDEPKKSMMDQENMKELQ